MNIDDSIRTRAWAKLEYYDPEKILREFGKIEQQIMDAKMDEKVRTLRTPSLKHHKEGREAALLCHGIGTCVLGTTVYFSPTEASDHDFVSRWREDNIDHYAPVQLKELVPNQINSTTALKDVISGLSKYTDSKDLIIGIYSNRAGTYKLSDIECPALDMAGIWMFGSITPDKSKWFLYGDLLGERRYYEFLYPA